MAVEKIRTGTLLEDAPVRENRANNVWTVMNGLLLSDSVREFNEQPSINDLKQLRIEYGYTKGWININEDKRLIVITPVDVSGISI